MMFLEIKLAKQKRYPRGLLELETCFKIFFIQFRYSFQEMKDRKLILINAGFAYAQS